MIRCTVLLLASQGAADRTMASAPTRATEASAMKLPRSVRKTAMIRMGNSSPTAPAAYILAERAAEHVVVPQDREQCAQSRGGQRQPDRHVVLDVAGRAHPRRHPHGDHRRDQPAEDR